MTTWVDLEDVMLSDICQTRKDRHCAISLMCGTLEVELTEAESRTVVDGGGELSGL